MVKAIRGGTDGAQLSYMGLPCPNIFYGGEFSRSLRICPVRINGKATQVIIQIAQRLARFLNKKTPR